MPHNETNYYVVVITDNNTKPGNIGRHSEFQDGRQVLNNTILNYIYHNEGSKAHGQLSTYPETQNMAENVSFAGFNDNHFEFRFSQES